jgi:hypothetical protein
MRNLMRKRLNRSKRSLQGGDLFANEHQQIEWWILDMEN